MAKDISSLDKQKLDDLVLILSNFKSKLQSVDYIHDKEKYFSIMRDFRKFIASVDDTVLCDTFFHSKHYKDFELVFKMHNYYYLRALETVEALAIMTKGVHNGSNFLDLLDFDHFKHNYMKRGEDFTAVDFSRVNTVIAIGCGPMPETMIYLYEYYDIPRIIGLDNNYEAVYMAGELISSMNLNKIEIMYSDALLYDYSQADLIYIPAFPSPKDDIIKRITHTTNDNVQIIVEQPRLLLKMLYDPIAPDLHPRLKVSNIHTSDTVNVKRDVIKLEKYTY